MNRPARAAEVASIVFLVVFSILTVLPVPVFALQGNLVGTSTSAWAVNLPNFRKAFYGNLYYWVFFYDGAYLAFRSSLDAVTWSATVQVRTCVGASAFSIWFDGTYCYYAYADQSANMYYRVGTLGAGSITWAAERTARTGYAIYYPTVVLNSAGLPFITYSSSLDGYDIYNIRCASNDGTGAWTETKLKDTAVIWNVWFTCTVPLTNGKVYALYGPNHNAAHSAYDNYIYGKAWDGSAWGSEVRSTVLKDVGGFSAVNSGDNVCLTYSGLAATFDVWYRKYTYATSTWDASETKLQTGDTTDSSPSISINTAASDLHVFWVGLPTANKIYYTKYTYASSTWDNNPTLWLDETTDTIPSRQCIYTYYQEYNSQIGLVYESKASSPYNVRIGLIQAGPPPKYYLTTYWNTGGIVQRNGTIYNNGTSSLIGNYYAAKNYVFVAIVNSSTYYWIKWTVNGSDATGNPKTISIGGNTTIWGIFAVTPTATPYAAARYNYTSTRPFIADLITFDGSSSVSSSSITDYSWNFGDGNTTNGASYSTIEHQYATANNFTCALTISAAYQDSFSQTVSVIAYHDPFARFIFDPDEIHPDELVQFNATTSKTLEGTITNYAWNFGDTFSTSGSTPSHGYSAVGLYTVALTITNSYSKTDAWSCIINVTAARSAGDLATAGDLASAMIVVLIFVPLLILVMFAIFGRRR